MSREPGRSATGEPAAGAGEPGEPGEPLPPRPSIWLATAEEPAKPARSAARNGLDRERITEASVRLLDAEGLAKFSMRRLAGEMGVTAMSLYWYVDTKDDLLELALDAAFAELTGAGTEGGADDWRAELRALSAGYRALLVRHPWASALAGTYLNIGPHSMAFARRLRQVLARTGLGPERQQGAMEAVSQFVYGFGTAEGHYVERSREAGMTQDAYFRHAMGSIRRHPGLEGDFTEPGRLRAERGGHTVEEMRERDFATALDLLVAGIEAMVAREE
ncbi:TetR/AcrR family transcriptional regulator C-terminal domain-containing protein [Streptomyces albidoflavus]|uniref:TetR/AcrR family transcriptional regulator C-terminal domain-containing protein n=1 Tax=Streptomyces albidoflavus TaxID=1886 RepID=UPI0013D9D387|nr:TetR/AcrR family transcriptional regulator [Streptomyces albidoflavus]